MAGDEVSFYDVLTMVGDSGRWQYITFLFTWIEGVLIGFHHLSSSFLGYEPAHWCSFPSRPLNFPSHWTHDQKKEFFIPKVGGELSKCEMYDFKQDFIINNDFNSALANRSNVDIIKCTNGWEYATDMGRTIVTEWDLVCDRLPLLSTVQGSYMGGVFVGCLFWGWASDKFGRRPSVLAASAIQILSTIVTAFSTHYVMFIFFRFLVAFSVSGVFECGFVLVCEIVGPKLRTSFGILTQFPFGVGASLLVCIAYFLRDWTSLQLATSVPCVLLVSYYWFIPESPRWLVGQGRVQEALVILKKGARINRKFLPSDDQMMEILDKIYQKSKGEVEADTVLSTKEKILDALKELTSLFKTPEMRKRSLNMIYSWMAVAVVYYGLTFETKHISTDIYIPMFISCFVEVVATVVIIPALAYFGRKKVYSGTFILGGLCCVAVAVILFAAGKKNNLTILTVTFAMIGKFLVAGTFALAYLYTAELFPTPVRNMAVGLASTSASIGSMFAPYIVDLLGRVHGGIPVVVFGVFSTTAGLFALWLPETLNKKLPATVEEVEASAKGLLNLYINPSNILKMTASRTVTDEMETAKLDSEQ